ncbi:MAG TPA: hypothetical protein VFV52_16350 [Bacilli bacterium]|nr:hypothetical protein [Bacilli bacterium]
MSGGKKLNIYKFDNWNQGNLHQHGRRMVVSEISSVTGEETFEFHSRQELLHWAERHYTPERFGESAEVCAEILQKLKNFRG